MVKFEIFRAVVDFERNRGQIGTGKVFPHKMMWVGGSSDCHIELQTELQTPKSYLGN